MCKEACNAWKINSFCYPTINPCLLSYRHLTECWDVWPWTNVASIPPRSLWSSNRRGIRNQHLQSTYCMPEILVGALVPISPLPNHAIFSIHRGEIFYPSSHGWNGISRTQTTVCLIPKPVQFSPVSFSKIQMEVEAIPLLSVPSSGYSS